METEYQGAIDNQNEEEKKLNYTQQEIVAKVSPVIWEEKDINNIIRYTIRNQDGSGSCVSQTYATEMGILAQQRYGVWIDFSSSFPYQNRKYPQSSGCTSEDIYSIFPKLGNVTEKDMPSQERDDEGMMKIKGEVYTRDVAKTFKVARIAIPIDFETVASTIQETGKGVMVWFKFRYDEWLDTPVIKPGVIQSGHSVTAIAYGLFGGKKYLVIQDSWGLDKAVKGLRLISEEYFKERCFLASYLMNFKMEEGNNSTPRPVFDGTIISAQKCFKWEGVFPLNIAEVENWGNITRSACKLFQKRYGIIPQEGNFGPITKAKLFELYK